MPEYGPTTWTWDFGDGTTSNERNPRHNLTLGSHTVTHTVTNRYGTSTTTKTFDVKWGANCDAEIAKFYSIRILKPFRNADGTLPPVAELKLAGIIPKTIPVDISSTRVHPVEHIPVSEYQGTAITAGNVQTTNGVASITQLGWPRLSADTLKLRQNINKTLKAYVNMNQMAAGSYSFTVNLKDTRSGKLVAQIPIYFGIEAVPKIKVTPRGINLGTLSIGDSGKTEFTIKNLGNIPLECTITAPPEYIFPGRVTGSEGGLSAEDTGWPSFNVSIPAGGSVPVKFGIDTVYKAQVTQDTRSSSILIESNDPETPSLEIPVTYILSAPKAQMVDIEIPDIISTTDMPLDVYVKMKNDGTIPWGKSFNLGVPGFGDSALFVGEDAIPPAGTVNPGQTWTYRLSLDPAAGTPYGDYTLAFEMFYKNAKGERVFFGTPVFKPINYGQSPPTIQVTSPNGGESWQAGSTHSVTWNQTRLNGTYVRIDLWKEWPVGIHQMVIEPWVPAEAGTYSWTIPTNVTPGTTYWVNITSPNYPAVGDYTDGYLAITPPTGNVRVKCLDDANNALEGWTFTLKNQTAGTPVFTDVTDSSGKIQFSNVPYGQYWLNETVKPSFYQITPNQLISVPPDPVPPGGFYTFTNRVT
ncbi:MAG: PKD domain-containing protein [Methanoregulaceae archaeon]|nr:PKD domain-containing protein [Methanoregulaceae archaeon]